MKVDVLKRYREVKWTTEHSLSKDQLKQLIDQKTERVRKEIEKRKLSPIHKLHG
jgi:hypothetical protein